MGNVIPYGVLKAKIESRKPKPVPEHIELRARVHKSDPWRYFGKQNSVSEAHRTAQQFHENCEYIITNFGVVVDHHRKTRAKAIGGGKTLDKPWGKVKIASSGHVSGMKGERFEIGTGFHGPCETKPVTVREEFTGKNGKVKTREIRIPDNHTISRKGGKIKRIQKPPTGLHKWVQKASKASGSKS